MGGGGPGLGSMFMATAAGSLAGNFIANQWASAPGHQLPKEAPQVNAAQAQEMSQSVAQQDPCKAYFLSFAKCCEMQNSGDATAAVTGGQCNWAWDMIKQCRTENNLA